MLYWLRAILCKSVFDECRPFLCRKGDICLSIGLISGNSEGDEKKITETYEQALTEVDELIQQLDVEKYTAMCRTAFSSLNDYGLAETAVQETFLVALRFREKFAASKNPVGWLYKALSYIEMFIRE